MRYLLLLLLSASLWACQSGAEQTGSEAETEQDSSRSTPLTAQDFAGRHAPRRVENAATFTLTEESQEDYQRALGQQQVFKFKDRQQYQDMRQSEKDLCWDVPLSNKQRKLYCPSDVDQFKLAYLGRWEERKALVFEQGIPEFPPTTSLVELEGGWEIDLEGVLYISPGSRWVVGIANEPVIWVGMYIYDAQSLNFDRVYEVGEPDGSFADAYHRFSVRSPVWVSDEELHLYEESSQTGEKKYYVLRIEA